jgi:hypothetical protein
LAGTNCRSNSKADEHFGHTILLSMKNDLL